MADKRADYFAGTQVVWDVDPSAPSQPTTYQRGQTAEAEPALPGWHVAVDWIFA
jgi:Uma2 family endonuclease